MASSNPATVACSQAPLNPKQKNKKPSPQFENQWKDVEGTETPVTWSLDPFLSYIAPYVPARLQSYLPTFTNSTCLSPCVEDELQPSKNPNRSKSLKKEVKDVSDPDASTVSSDTTSSSSTDIIIKQIKQLDIESDSGHEAGSEYSAGDEESASDEASIPRSFLKTLDLRDPVASSTPPPLDSPSSSATTTPKQSISPSSYSPLPLDLSSPFLHDSELSSSKSSDSDSSSVVAPAYSENANTIPSHPSSTKNICQLPLPPTF